MPSRFRDPAWQPRKALILIEMVDGRVMGVEVTQCSQLTIDGLVENGRYWDGFGWAASPELPRLHMEIDGYGQWNLVYDVEEWMRQHNRPQGELDPVRPELAPVRQEWEGDWTHGPPPD